MEQSGASGVVQNDAERGEDPIGEYGQTMEARCRYRIIGLSDKVSGENIGGREWGRRFRTTGMDTEVEEMWDGNR